MLLKIENNYSCLITEDQDIKTILWKALRFRERNYYHTSLYKQQKWDGFVDFFSQKTGKFLTGLLPEVRVTLKQLGVSYETLDKREEFRFLYDEIDEDFLSGAKLYDYQVELVNQVLKSKRGIIKAPTSAGKTLVMVAICKCLPPKTPALILVNRKSLVDQNYENLKQYNIPDVGRLYDKYQEPNYITCSTVQSVQKLGAILPKVKVLLVDEIHEMLSATSIKAYRQLTDAVVRVGMSATPFKFKTEGKENLKTGSGDKVQQYRVRGWIGAPFKINAAPDKTLTTKFLQERNILSKSKCVFYPIREPLLPYEIYLDAVTKGMAESKYFNETIARLVSTLSGRTLILVERLAHGDLLQSLIPGSLWIKGEDGMETRKFVIDNLTQYQGSVVGIATSGILNVGVNVKLMNLINAAGGAADHQVIQRIGRGMRVAADKDMLHYYDWVFDINPYLKNHSDKRIKILKKLGHEVIVKEEIDF